MTRSHLATRDKTITVRLLQTLLIPVILGLFSANTGARIPDKDATGAKITSLLKVLVERMDQAAAGKIARSEAFESQFRVNDIGEIYIYVSLSALSQQVLSELDAHGLTISNTESRTNTVTGWISRSGLDDLAAIDAVRQIRPVIQPETRAGSVLTEGDAVLGADVVRAMGFDGTGVKVGVISDDVDNMAAAQATGDLPAVTVLKTTPSSGDEGTAMLEIVHDLAPGADLYFYSGWNSSLDMADGMRALAAAGCDVIVDDIGYLGEPYFEDGLLAQVADSVAMAGILFSSAAGNSAQTHYQNMFTPAGATSSLHAWDLASDSALAVQVPPGRLLRVFLQWDDPFSASDNDYDLFIFADEALTEILAWSISNQDGTQSPFEAAFFENTSGSTVTVYVAVNRYSGVPRTLKLYFLGASSIEHPVSSGSIFGHPAARNVVAVAAINASNPNHDTIAPYSSRGPSYIAYPVPETRLKPDITAIDGVSVTGAGGFPSPFFGTSAAAPHIAGLAALIAQAQPSWTSTQIRRALTSTALDLGDPGPDYVFGHGRARVDRFFANSLTLSNSVVVPGENVPVEVGGTLTEAYSMNFAFTYDPSVITPDSPPVVSTAFDGLEDVDVWWIVVQGESVDTLFLAVAASEPLSVSGGSIAALSFLSTGAGHTALVWHVELSHVNDGTPRLADGSVTVEQLVYGDVTGDGSLSALDASYILQHVVRIRPDIDPIVADVSANGIITAYDAALILYKVVNPSYVFPVEGGAPLKPAGSPTLAWERDDDEWVLRSSVSGIVGIDLELRLPRGATVTSPALLEQTRDGDVVRLAIAGIRDGHDMVRIHSTAPPVVVNASVNEQEIAITQPAAFSLAQNVPNPFNPLTTLRFSVAEAGAVRLAIYDVNGRLVRTLVDGALPAGHHEAVWDGRDTAGRAVASGVYVYRLTSGEDVAVRRMTLVR